MHNLITIYLIAREDQIPWAISCFSVKNGQSLMQGATQAGIDGIAADCGGSLSCATCHVYVDSAWLDKLPAPSADELSMLEMTAAPRLPNSRLSCQLVATAALDGLRMGLPLTQY
jgi:ferredoxin, 2Fe-2S